MNESLWQLERLKREWEIQASQFSYWTKQLFWVWFLSAVVLVMFSCGQGERKSYAVTWVIASTTTFRQVPYKGEKYNRVKMLHWLNGSVYQGTLGQWCWWVGKWSGEVAIVCAMGGWLWIRRQREAGEQHVRGAEIVSVGELERRLYLVASAVHPSRGVGPSAGPGTIRIAGVPLPTEVERRHTLICGATGSGKSVALFDLLTQFEASDIPCIVVGGAGEIAARFYNEDRGDTLFNALDERCPTWTPWMEGDSEEAVAAQAASWFPIIPGMSNAAVYYYQQAQIRYRDLLLHARVRDVWQIPTMLKEEVEKKGSRFGKPEVISTMQNALESLRYLRPGTKDWSARGWVANPKGWVFLCCRKREEAAVLPLISFLLECLTRELLSSEESPGIRVRIVVEELAALGPQPTLFKIMNEGRKYGVPCTIAFQDVKQLTPLYGTDYTENMLAQPGTQLMLRTNGAATQQWCAQNIGQREMIRPVETETVGPLSVSDRVGRSHPARTEDALLASQFGQLHDGHGYLKIPPFGIARVTVPWSPVVARVPAFLPRGEESTPAPLPAPSPGGPAVTTLTPKVRRL